jgi:hypothetical protein
MQHDRIQSDLLMPFRILCLLGIPSLIALITVLCGTGRAENPIFTIETIAPASDLSHSVSLAYDPRGNPGICHSGPNWQLHYAERVGFEWTREPVDSRFNSGSRLYLAVDADGVPHIAYRSDGSETRYATLVGGHWSNELVLVGSGPRGMELAKGQPHILTSSEETPLMYRATDGWQSWPVPQLTSQTSVNGIFSIDMLPDRHFGITFRVSQRMNYVSTNTPPEIVDHDTPIGGPGSESARSRVGLDQYGTPHLAYYDWERGDLLYATKQNGAWQIEVADSVGDVGFFCSIALDELSQPHIGYYDRDLGILKWATKSDGQWTSTVVDSEGVAGWHVSLALGADGSPGLAYYDPVNQVVKFADSSIYLLSPLGGERWLADSWQRVRWRGTGMVTIEFSSDGGSNYSPLLTTDQESIEFVVPDVSTERAKIRIRREFPRSSLETPGLLSVAPGLVSPWWKETVETGSFAGNYPSLALDSIGEPRMSFLDVEKSSLKFAAKSGGHWTVETVDATGPTGWYGSLALSTDGQPRIGYQDFAQRSLRYASRDTAGWNLETVDASGDVGAFSSLALDAANRPSISYYDASGGDLKFAHNSGASWTIEIVDSEGDVGQHSSLELDGSGSPHISYYDSDRGLLKYATREPTWWVTGVVDSFGGAGKYCSLALDPTDQPMISYWDESNGDLKLASWIHDRWRHEVVDDKAAVLSFTSLDVDDTGRPWIGYQDGSGGDLKIAVKNDGWWSIETVDSDGHTGVRPSLVLDSNANPRIAYFGRTRGVPLYSSAAIELVEPSDRMVWPVGALRMIRWQGTGLVKLWISFDGGQLYEPLAEGVEGGEYEFTVPNRSTQDARIRIERQVPYSIAESYAAIVIESGVALLRFEAKAAASALKGVDLFWETLPGPVDLSGYRIERKNPASEWVTIVNLTTETSLRDADGNLGARYRLFSRNRLGEEQLVGETQFEPRAPLVAWPIPYHGGDMFISYAAASGQKKVKLSIFSSSGRLIRELEDQSVEEGFNAVTWDGRNASGVLVPGGVYFLRSRVGAETHTLKFVVVR